MITYSRSAFGLNLLFRLHGSATYRGFLPALVGVGIFLLIRTSPGMEERDLDHPYVVGIVVSGITFLIVFRASQGYSRYWEATTCYYQMASKWMDATIHTASYHMQSEQYAHMRPPSYFEHPHLDACFLTRDRERVRFSERGSQKKLMNPRRVVTNSINAVANAKPQSAKNHPASHPQPPPHPSDSPNTQHESEYGKNLLQIPVPPTINKQDRRNRHSFAFVSRLSLNPAAFADSKDNKTLENFDSSQRFIAANGSISDSFRQSTSFDSREPGRRQPRFLTGPARLDGNWSAVFPDQQPPTATFYDPVDGVIPPDSRGFGSTAGGRTPSLFLQELAHLSSLLVAVSLSTLRNDIDGAESPLDLYEPGSPWPHKDPFDCETLYPSRWKKFRHTMLFLMGWGRTREERTRYNAKRPLPVLGGVSDAEIRFLQMARGPYAKTQLCWHWLSEFITREHLAGSLGKVGAPIISRTMQFLGDGMTNYNNGRKVMSIPFPFVHAQLSAIFVIVLVGIVPYLMEEYTEDKFSGSILTFFSIAILSGIHEVARELENPFRNVPNELPLVTFMAEYNEALLTMYSGFHPDFFWEPPSQLQGKNGRRSPGPSSGGEVRPNGILAPRTPWINKPAGVVEKECAPENAVHDSIDGGLEAVLEGSEHEGSSSAFLESPPVPSKKPLDAPLHSSPDGGEETTIEFYPADTREPILSHGNENENEEASDESEVDKLRAIVMEQGKIMSKMLEEQARLNRMVAATLDQSKNKKA